MSARSVNGTRRARARTLARSFDHGQPLRVRHGLAPAAGDVTSAAPECEEYEVPPGGWPDEASRSAQQSLAEYDVPIERCGAAIDAPPPRFARRAPVPGPGAGAPAEPLPVTDDVVLSDIKSILSKSKSSPALPVERERAERPTAAARPAQPSQPLPPMRDEHAIFDRIAANMSRAKTYDLGDLALQQRFDSFDEDLEAAQKRTRELVDRKVEEATTNLPAEERATVSDFIEDLDRIESEKREGDGRAEGEADGEEASAAFAIPLDPGVGGRSIPPDVLEPGDVLLSTTEAAVSRTIRKATGAEVSHAAMYIGGGQVVEAIEDGVILRSLDTALEDDSLAVAYRHRDMTPQRAADVVRFLKDQVRAKRAFDNWGLVRVAPGQLARAICNRLDGEARKRCLANAERLRVGTDDDDAFYCSELILAALGHVGLSISEVDPSWSTPGEILDLHHNGLLDYVGHLKA